MIRPENPNAFPAPDDGRPSDGYGMTLRDWFAGQVLNGLHGIPLDQSEAESVARRCFMMADAMLAERSKAIAAATGEGL